MGGDQVYSSAVIGQQVGGPTLPTTPKSGPEAVRSDLETTFGVLVNELAQYEKQLSSCPSSKSCLRTFAYNAAQQFAEFDGSLNGYAFPARLSAKAASLDATTRKLNALYEAIDHGKETSATTSSIEKYEKVLTSDYHELVNGLS